MTTVVCNLWTFVLAGQKKKAGGGGGREGRGGRGSNHRKINHGLAF